MSEEAQQKECFMKNTINIKTIQRIVENLAKAFRRQTKVPLVIISLVAVIGLSMASCSSMPAGAEKSTLTPDASSAVVYFLQPYWRYGSADLAIFDGENPVGKINSGLYRNVAYKAKPGTHVFIAKRFNWSKVRLEIKANNVYYIKLGWAPNPIPFSDGFVILEVLSQKIGQEEFKKNERSIAFTDAWRTKYKSSLPAKYLAELRENLRR